MRIEELALALAEGFGEAPVEPLLGGDVEAEDLLAGPSAQPVLPPDLPPKVAARLRDPALLREARATARRSTDAGLTVLTRDDPRWPGGLTRLSAPPRVLFARGDLGALRRQPAATFVGSRTPTPYGAECAEVFGRALARSATTLWSGLARGVDAIGHRACLAAATPTVAVLAGGHDALYPPEHAALAEQIAATGGCVLSELPLGRRARRGHFVRRNRILAAGTPATVVVEAGIASGALHTARFAGACGADVHCVPGPWQSERSKGCHRLVNEGAALVEDVGALLQALGLAPTATPQAARHLCESADEQAVLHQLRAGPRPADLLGRESGLGVTELLRALGTLEQRGAVRRVAGDLWASADAPFTSR